MSYILQDEYGIEYETNYGRLIDYVRKSSEVFIKLNKETFVWFGKYDDGSGFGCASDVEVVQLHKFFTTLPEGIPVIEFTSLCQFGQHKVLEIVDDHGSISWLHGVYIESKVQYPFMTTDEGHKQSILSYIEERNKYEK